MESIGVAGNVRGAGATHMALSMAVFQGSVCGKRTAYIDCSGNNQIKNMISLFGGRFSEMERGFSLKEVDFYYDLSENERLAVWNASYECIVLECGVLGREKEIIKEYGRCSRSFLVCDLADWKKQDFLYETAKNAVYNGIKMEYIAGKGEKTDITWAEKETGIKISLMGYIPDPFELGRRDVQKLREIFRKR